MRPIDISSCWNTIPKLMKKQRGERAWLKANRNGLEALLRTTIRKLPRFEARPLANTIHGLGTLASAAVFAPDANVWRDLRQSALLRLDDFKAQELANTAWAFAVADMSAEELFASPRFIDGCAQARFTEEGLTQLHQYSLWLDERSAPWAPLPTALRERCRESFITQQASATISRLQTQVTDALKGLGLDVREEVRVPPPSLTRLLLHSLNPPAALGAQVVTEQGYSLDAVVRVGGHEVAVEVDGPSHFVGRQPTGATTLKRRQLRESGWALVDVPFWEWDALKTDHAKKAEYLRGKLSAVGAGVPEAVHAPAKDGPPHKRPRGRAPKGKTWNEQSGEWTRREADEP